MELPGFVSRYINVPLLSEPLNWAIVWIIASIWLLAFHTLMTGFRAMMYPTDAAIGAGPGQIASPIADATTVFSQIGNYGQSTDLGSFYGNGVSSWTDGSESKFAEDGWAANY